MMIINIIQMILLSLWTIFIVYILSPFFNYKGAWWITVNLWAPGIAYILLTRIEVKGIENIDPKKHYIFMSNHASYFDIACLFIATKRNLHFLAKYELSRNFFTGYMLRKLQIIFIDRTNSQRSAASLLKAVEHIQKGKNVAIFPEGTRTRTGKLGVFRKGGFKLAVQSNTPIIPVSITNSAKAWPIHHFGFRPTTVTVTFGPEIQVTGIDENDTKELIDSVYTFISNNTQNS